MNLYVILSSRTEGLKLLQELKNNRLSCQLKNIPNEIKRSCGVAIVTNFEYLNYIKSIINSGKIKSMRSFYLFSSVNGRPNYRKIN